MAVISDIYHDYAELTVHPELMRQIKDNMLNAFICAAEELESFGLLWGDVTFVEDQKPSNEAKIHFNSSHTAPIYSLEGLNGVDVFGDIRKWLSSFYEEQFITQYDRHFTLVSFSNQRGAA